MAIIRSGPATVFDSGVVTGFDGHPIAIRVAGPGAAFTVTLAFETDPSVEDVRVDPVPVEGGLVLTCVNFDGPDGRGSAQPVLLGEVGPWRVWFHFRVFRYGRTDDRTVHYTFFQTPIADGAPPAAGGG